MNFARLFFVIIILFAMLPSSVQASDAITTLKAKHEVIVELKNTDNAKLQKELDNLIDYRWLAEQSLGGSENFKKTCNVRCEEFELLLTRLIRKNYLQMAQRLEKYPVEYVGQVEGKNGAYKVTTKIKIDKNGREQTVVVEYVMRQADDGTWQVRDIITDDVSLAKTYRYEFNKIAKAEGIDGIIRKLEDKLIENL